MEDSESHALTAKAMMRIAPGGIQDFMGTGIRARMLEITA